MAPTLEFTIDLLETHYLPSSQCGLSPMDPLGKVPRPDCIASGCPQHPLPGATCLGRTKTVCQIVIGHLRLNGDVIIKTIAIIMSAGKCQLFSVNNLADFVADVNTFTKKGSREKPGDRLEK